MVSRGFGAGAGSQKKGNRFFVPCVFQQPAKLPTNAERQRSEFYGACRPGELPALQFRFPINSGRLVNRLSSQPFSGCSSTKSKVTS